METHLRSIAKTISWRALATLITFAISLLLTGRLDIAVKIGLADTLVKLFVYYFHERAWNRAKFGRVESSDYQI